jgi:hypothetical protein
MLASVAGASRSGVDSALSAVVIESYKQIDIQDALFLILYATDISNYIEKVCIPEEV